MIILVLIELMPVIAKSLLPAGAYDEKARLQEDLEKEMTRRNISRDRELKEYFNDVALGEDKDAIDHFFAANRERRRQKMEDFGNNWRMDKHQSFDGLWQQMKKDIMTRWEN